MKIPTTVGGKIKHSGKPKPILTKKKTAYTTGTSINDKEHKVRILGDGHLRGTAIKVNQNLNTKFEVCSLIKPGANTEKLVNTLEILGKRRYDCDNWRGERYCLKEKSNKLGLSEIGAVHAKTQSQ